MTTDLDPPKPVDRETAKPFNRLRRQLGKTRARFADRLGGLFSRGRRIDPAMLEELEELLLMADVGMEATQAVLGRLTARGGETADAGALYRNLKQQLFAILEPSARPLGIPPGDGPMVIMVVGVNGVGKTTTIGKLAHRFKQAGHTVMLAAADTFRAAAIEQLQSWGERNDVPVIAQQHGADAASVAHDAMQAATARRCDVLIVDTAGRQHTQRNLMEELKKIKRVIGKLEQRAPQEVLMVLDAGTGQNALSQLKHFHAAVEVTGLCLTKLDGTAKGGILFAMASRTGLPIRYVGIGEGIEDLREFDAAEFVDALLPDAEDTRKDE